VHRNATLLIGLVVVLAVAIALIGGGWSWDSPTP
jgi:hypothetical protein